MASPPRAMLIILILNPCNKNGPPRGCSYVKTVSKGISVQSELNLMAPSFVRLLLNQLTQSPFYS